MKTLTTITDLQPDPHNANAGTLRGDQLLSRSLDDHGAARSIVVDADGVVIAGSKTLEQAAERSLPVRVVRTTGDRLVVVQRTDLDLADPKTRALAYLDNRAAEEGLAWDPAQLEADLAMGIQFGGMFSQEEIDGLLHSAEVLLAHTVFVFDTEADHQRWERLLAFLDTQFADLPGIERYGDVPVSRLDAWVSIQLSRLSSEVVAP